MTRVLGVLTTAAIVPFVSSCAAPLASSRACGYGPWGQPRELTSQNVILRNPSITVAEGSIIAVGNNIVLWSDSLIPDSVFRAYPVSSSHLRPPEPLNGRIRFDPRIIAGQEGVFLVWAESEKPMEVGRDWWFPNANTIWVARYTPGEVWSLPERRYESSRRDGIGIDFRRSGNLTIHRSRAYLTFLDGLNPSTLVQFELDSNARRDTLFLGSGWDLSIASMGSRGMMAAYAGYDEKSDRSGVVYFTTRRLDEPWQEPVQLPVRDPSEDDASDLAVTYQGDRISVFWRNETGIFHYWTPDRGLAWQGGRLIHGPTSNIGDLQVVADECGNAHVVYSDIRDEAKPIMGYAVLDSAGKWIESGPPFPGFHAIQPSLVAESKRIVLVASTKDPLDDTGSTFRPMYVERRRADPVR